ncbi:MAG: PHP domain-containing protein, partial [Sciscionella sp.]
MGFYNPPVSWRDLERALSGRDPVHRGGYGPQPDLIGDGNDSPAWSRHRDGYVAPESLRVPGAVDEPDGNPLAHYAELHCHSNFSFLDGASHPEELVETAAKLGLDAIALTDHDGMYGVVRFAQAAKELGVRTVYGAELSLGLSAPQNGVADPEGEHLLLLAKHQDGYTSLCRAISAAQLAGRCDPRSGSADIANGSAASSAEKGKPAYDLDRLVDEVAGQCVVLTGCRKGAVRKALRTGGPAAAARELRRLVSLFGAENVHVELTDHGLPQ